MNSFESALSIFNIKICYFIRRLFLRSLGANISNDLKIEKGAKFRNADQLSIGQNVYINNWFWCNAKGGISIGNDVLFGPNVTIHSSNHRYDDPNLAINRQGHVDAAVLIENNIWIGAGVTILPGASICSGCIIGASSVVTGSILKKGLYAGVPAKLIKELK